MSPETLEKTTNFSPENRSDKEKFLDIERGDSTLFLQRDQNNNQQQTQQQSNQFDPVVFVKSMLSGGFTPSKQQIQIANSGAQFNTDSSEHWFGIFLLKIIHQEKLDRARK